MRYRFMLLAYLLILLSPSLVLAIPDIFVSITDVPSEVGWGEQIHASGMIRCDNNVVNCVCRYEFSSNLGSSGLVSITPSIPAKWSSTNYKVFDYTFPPVRRCGTESITINLNVKCKDYGGSIDKEDFKSKIVSWPTSAQEKVLSTATNKINSVPNKRNQAAQTISDATGAINNAKSYGSNCVATGQAESSLQDAQSKNSAASNMLNTANNLFDACNGETSYRGAIDSASNAESTFDAAISAAMNAKNGALAAVNDYNTKKSQAMADIAAANSAIQSASTAIADANDLLGKAKSKSSCIDVEGIQKRLETASQSVNSARTAVASAQSQIGSCNFAQVSAYTDQSKKDAESGRSIALIAKQEAVNLLNQYDQKKGNSDVELSNAQQLLTSARTEIDKVEQKLKQSEKLGCIEEIGLAGATGFKAEAESMLTSGNEQHSLAKANYDSCDFDASVAASKKSQGFSTGVASKATAASNAIDQVVEQTQQKRDGIADQVNQVKNTIDTAENIDNTINDLLVEHPEETLGKSAFSEAKARREQGREKIRAAKTEYDKAVLDFQGADCSKATGTIQTAAGFANEALQVLTTAHEWITLKIQEAGDCANNINQANLEVNQLYFKSEFGRMYMTDVLDMLINVTPKKISLTHVAQLQKDVQQESVNVLKNADAARLKLDEGDFGSCIPLAQSVRNGAVQIRTKTEEAISQISADVQMAAPAILDAYTDLNKQKKEDIASKGFVITGSENIPIAESKAKENDRLIQEIKAANDKLPLLNGFTPMMEQTQAIATKAAKVEENAEFIDSALGRVNRAFWIGIIIGLIVAVLITGGVYAAVRTYKRRPAKVKSVAEPKPERIKEKGKEPFWQLTKKYLSSEFRSLIALFGGKKATRHPQSPVAEIEISCDKCGVPRKLIAGQKFCNACGDRLIRHCLQCGHLLKSTQKFCNRCGIAIPKKEETPKVQEKPIIKKEHPHKKIKKGRKKRQ